MSNAPRKTLSWFSIITGSVVAIVFATAIATASVYYLNAVNHKATQTGQQKSPPVTQKPDKKEATPPQTPPPHHDAVIPPVVNGVAPVISRIETTEPVVFLGIDDGGYKNQKVVDLLKKNNIKATLFLSDLFIHNNPDFFKQIIAEGSLVENHTVHHDTRMFLKSLSYQRREICDMSDLDEQYYGRRPYLFRPPGGSYTVMTQQAAADCGMRVVVNWIAKANGGSMQYQIGYGLSAGDIVLMHFRPEFEADLTAFVQAQDAAGLHTELLEDWISPE